MINFVREIYNRLLRRLMPNNNESNRPRQGWETLPYPDVAPSYTQQNIAQAVEYNGQIRYETVPVQEYFIAPVDYGYLNNLGNQRIYVNTTSTPKMKFVTGQIIKVSESNTKYKIIGYSHDHLPNLVVKIQKITDSKYRGDMAFESDCKLYNPKTLPSWL